MVLRKDDGGQKKVKKKDKSLDAYFQILSGNVVKKGRQSNGTCKPCPDPKQMRIPDIPFIARTKVPPFMHISDASNQYILAVVCPLSLIMQHAETYRTNLVEFQCTNKVAFVDRMLHDNDRHCEAGIGVYWVAIAAVESTQKLSLFETMTYTLTVLGSGNIGTIKLSRITLHENNQCGWACVRFGAHAT